MTPVALPDHPHLDNPAWFNVEIIGRGPGATTFALVKPDGHPVHTEEILDMIQDAGLTVLTWMERQLLPMDIRALYWPHVGKFFYDRNAEFIASAPVLLLALAGDDAVDRWRNHLMPKIRERWGQHNDDPEKKHLNLVHGSDNAENAFRELLYFFG